MDFSGFFESAIPVVIAFGLKALGALALYIVGRWLIGIVGTLRCVHTEHYWQVCFDTNKTIRETFGAAGYPAPEAHLFVRQKAA